MTMLSNHYSEERPWGSFERFTANEASTVKLLNIDADMRLSDQRHAHRDEYWVVLEGTGTVELDGEVRPIQKEDRIEIPRGMWHRVGAGAEALTILEIAVGDFDENDIERRNDDFGRADAGTP